MLIFTLRFTLSPALSLPRVASTLPFTFTGADLYALCSDAMLKAVTRSARQVDDRVAEINQERAVQRKPNVTIAGFFDHYATDTDLQVLVEEQDFELARRELVPSVSVDELRHYESVRDQFEGGAKKQAQAQEISERPAVQGSSPNENEKKAAAKAKFNELMRKQSSKNKVPTVNGNAAMVVNGQQAEPGAEASDGDDDFVVRTDKLTLGGSNGKPPSRPTSARSNTMGKGKGKGREEPVGDGVDGGEDLYD